MQRTLGLAAIAVLAAFPPSAMAQHKVEIGPDQPCTAAFGTAGYPALTRLVPGDLPAPARQVAIEEIGQGGQSEDGGADQRLGDPEYLPALELGQQHDDEQGHQEHADDGQHVGEIHGDRFRLHVRLDSIV